MFTNNLRTLCTALGFTAVAMKENVPKENLAGRAVVLAKMIEDFCITVMTNDTASTQINTTSFDGIIERLKDDVQSGRSPDMPKNGDLLRQIYLRLQQRHNVYATDDLVADEIRHLLEEENQQEAGGNMRVIDLCQQQTTKHFGQHQTMASVIADVLATKGECYPSDLEARGFSAEEIKRNWQMAYGLAKVESMFMQG